MQDDTKEQLKLVHEAMDKMHAALEQMNAAGHEGASTAKGDVDKTLTAAKADLEKAKDHLKEHV